MRELLFDKAIPSSLAINANHLPNPSDGYHFTVGQFAVGSRSMSGCVGEMLLMQIVNDDKTHTQQVFEIQSNGSFLHKTVSQLIDCTAKIYRQGGAGERYTDGKKGAKGTIWVTSVRRSYRER